MKARKTLFLFLVTIFSLNIYAQLKVKPNGKTIIGLDRTGDDSNNILSASIFGTGGEYRYGSKIAFGDFGTYGSYSWNAFIGEYGNYDSDRLWLHGNNGIYLTYSNGDHVIGSYDVNNGNKFNFNCEVWSSGLKLTSDERLKINISKIDNSMTKLRKLNGVSYNLLNKESITNKSLTESVISSDTIKMTDKEKDNKAFFEAYEANVKNAKPKRMGLIAQDLQKVYPELVDKDSSGYYSVDYIGLIPVMIEALKELDSIIEVQNTQINDLIVRLGNSTPKKIGASQETDILTYPVLDQNIPNPFNTATTIGFSLPASTITASVYVYNMNGVQLKSYPIDQRGKGNITIQGSEFSAGMYLYALIADDKVIDTKRMILTK